MQNRVLGTVRGGGFTKTFTPAANHLWLTQKPLETIVYRVASREDVNDDD